MAAVTNIPFLTSLPTGSASVSGQPGSSSVQGQELDREEEDSVVEDKDVLELLDEGESLELIEFDPTVEAWEAADIINTFLVKNFTKVIDEKEVNKIMADFPKPNCSALRTPKG